MSDSLKIKSIREAFQEELSYIKGRHSGEIKSAKTPWQTWNEIYTSGFEWGWIVTIAGLSGSGKTALLNILETAMFESNPEQDIAVLSFNFEMLARRLVGRKISGMLKKSVKQLYSADVENNVSDEEIRLIETMINENITKYDISYVEIPGNVQEISDAAEKFILKKLEENPDKKVVITLDHSILVKKLRGSERDTLTELMACFNELKKKYPNMLFILLSQLNRNIEKEERKKAYGPERTLHFPQKSDIFGSESLYQFSDAVIVFHRPELLGLQTYGTKAYPTKDLVYCHHLKARDGLPKVTRFENKLNINQLKEII
jgi:replicative DNA helicase